jgi:myo-inositol-1-phosphate synthase
MVGACGNVGATTALGIAALRKRKCPATGLVSELPYFRNLPLCAPGDCVIGGHEIRGESLLESVRALHRRANLFEPELIQACAADFRAMQRNIWPGTLYSAGPTIRRRPIPKDGFPTPAPRRRSNDYPRISPRFDALTTWTP